MAERFNKKTVCILAGLVLIVAVAVVAFVIIKNNNGSSSDNGGGSNSSSLVTSDDLKKVDVEVAYDDYDAMKALSKDIQNGKMTGKVVKVDGLVNHPGQSYSIAQKSADGKQKIGTVFTIEDGESADYPADGTRIVITAKVVEKEALNYQLVTLKEFVKKN